MTYQGGKHVIEVEDLSYKYAHSHGASLKVINSIDFYVSSGEILAILGPSGCGKSTLLKLISGLLTPFSGHITLWGGDANTARNDKRIGFVFQDPSMLSWRTVEQNVRLPLELRKEPEQIKKTSSALQTVGLAGFEKFFPSELSGGMLARANIARALVNSPTLLLLDEPFAHLDDVSRLQLQRDIADICRSLRMTVLLVTHNLSEAISFSDRLLLLSSRPAKVLKNIKLNRSLDPTGAANQQIIASVRKLFAQMSYQ